jgi:prolipoprotein diacylglyceryltransferase
MIPYLELPASLPVFLGCTTAGLALGARVSTCYARARGLDERRFRGQLLGGLILGCVGACLVPLLIGGGLSSLGGMLGGTLGMLLACRRRGLRVWSVADANVFGMLAGMALCRLGCAATHDHVGRLADASDWLAVGPWPDGSVRYDLGLLELLFFGLAMVVVYLLWDWRHARPGRLSGLVASSYGLWRLAVESLRDPGGSTGASLDHLGFAECAAAALVGAGFWLTLHTKEKKR